MLITTSTHDAVGCSQHTSAVARQRGCTCGAEVDDALRVIAESCDYICAERLHPNLVAMAQQLTAHSEVQISPGLLERLEQISAPTVRHILQRIRQDEPRLPRRGPERASLQLYCQTIEPSPLGAIII